MKALDFQDVADQVAAGMAGDPITLLDFEDVRSALFMAGQIEKGQFLADKILQMIPLLGILGKRYAHAYEGRAASGKVAAGVASWDGICRTRHVLFAHYCHDQDLAALILLHQEMSNYCKAVHADALVGAREFQKAVREVASAPADRSVTRTAS